MRLIDADALIEQMEADAEHIDDLICKLFAYAAISDVKRAPTIEPQRMRGRWVIVDGSVCCSECGNPNMEFDFCPYCGADMRETG